MLSWRRKMETTNGYGGPYADRLKSMPPYVAEAHTAACKDYGLCDSASESLARILLESNPKNKEQARTICLEAAISYMPHPGSD
jgi:hypothetical protein